MNDNFNQMLGINELLDGVSDLMTQAITDRGIDIDAVGFFVEVNGERLECYDGKWHDDSYASRECATLAEAVDTIYRNDEWEHPQCGQWVSEEGYRVERSNDEFYHLYWGEEFLGRYERLRHAFEAAESHADGLREAESQNPCWDKEGF